ncbi:MAG: cytochrome c biogenesis protein ResB [Desulfuromonadales bacterium]
MSNIKNAAWRFFASVKLALIVLIILATTSIIGTLIKQGQTPAYYVQEYGPSLARIFERLDITNMYSSWWFVALLCLFAINLVICSIERLPGVWRTVVLDNLAVDPVKLEKMSFTHQTGTSLSVDATVERIHRHMVQTGWNKPRRLDRGDSLLLFSQKGAWTRLGVYVVHLSILIILVGAITGSFFGFQAYVFLPEGRATSNIFLRKDKEPYPLGFKLQCDRFEKTFYPNGMVKQYRADLSILDPEREGLYKKSIIVNDPLTYQGLNFYVGDSFPLDEYFV